MHILHLDQVGLLFFSGINYISYSLLGSVHIYHSTLRYELYKYAYIGPEYKQAKYLINCESHAV